MSQGLSWYWFIIITVLGILYFFYARDERDGVEENVMEHAYSMPYSTLMIHAAVPPTTLLSWVLVNTTITTHSFRYLYRVLLGTP